MKIFLSHSSRDKWAARRIAEDIDRLGATTFLDEKDIETGESIDEAIAAHLKDCDEVLVLLSPASVSSDWVLIEVGGAKALGKRLVPILLYLGANDIPSPIAKQLARDINNIDLYYDELQKRIEGNAPPPPPVQRRRVRVAPSRDRKAFRVGDIVRLPENPQRSEEREGSPTISWESDMEQYLGEKATVMFVDEDRSLQLDIDDGLYWWAFEWLKKDT